jgi:purine-binding chemotaxis protein CheW
MNLAEIRKKAKGAKKSVTAADNPLPPEGGIEAGSAEFEIEPLAGETEFFAEETVSEEEEFSPPAKIPSAYAEACLPEEPPLTDARTSTYEPFLQEVHFTPEESLRTEVTDIRQVQSDVESVTTILPRHPVATEESEAAFVAPPVVATVRSGYNPLATIMSGREEALDLEETSAYQQQSLAAGDVEEYLCFRVADEEYALSIMAVKEIIKPRDVTEVPRMPAFVTGVISLRGVIIPVIDMRLRLSLPVRVASGRERIIVLRTDTVFCGVLVDEVVQVARIRKADIEEPPAVLEEIDRDFVRGLGHFDNRMLILLNLETIIDVSIH